MALSALLALAYAATLAYRSVKHRGEILCANASTTKTNETARTYFADAAISTRNLLYKQGSDVTHIAVAGASDVVLGTVDDEVTTANLTDQPVAVILLGAGPSTVKMVANAAITAGTAVYQAASGKVAPTGIRRVGTALTAAAADGDVIEVNSCIPQVAPAATTPVAIFAGTRSWAGGAATTDAVTLTGLLSTDIVVATLRARASTETLVLAVPTADTLTFTLSANGTNTTTKLDYVVFRAA